MTTSLFLVTCIDSLLKVVATLNCTLHIVQDPHLSVVNCFYVCCFWYVHVLQLWSCRSRSLQLFLCCCHRQSHERNAGSNFPFVSSATAVHMMLLQKLVVHSCISLHACCIIVTWWGGPGGIWAWSDDWPSSFSALTLLVGSHDL